MTVVICPTCNSDLIEPNKHGRLDCIFCGDDFTVADAKVQEVSMSEINARLVAIHTNNTQIRRK